MTADEKLIELKKSPLCANLPDEDILTLANHVEEASFKEGEFLIEQDDLSDTAFFIIEGGVNIYRITEDGNEMHISIQGEGEIVGEMSLMDGHPRSAFVQAIQPSRTLFLKRGTFEDLIHKNPQFAINLIKALVVRLRDSHKRFEDALYKNLEQRTLIILQALAPFFPGRDIIISQEELALVIGATRARVTESLNKLEKAGKVTLSHKKIHLN